MEHFVTLFDSGFLPQGLSLYASLENQGEPFTLWVICMDLEAEIILLKLSLPNLIPIALRSVETLFPALLEVKPTRSRAEYCWTLTPFSYAAVLKEDPSATRITYVDADVAFFGPASELLNEMDAQDCDVLLTDHAYAPEYQQESTSGRYCVQFLPFRTTPGGLEVLTWWQDRCIEWCYARFEDGKFGDQKYLDDWTVRWGNRAKVLKDVHLTLAPWNAAHLFRHGQKLGIYHFHNLRIYAQRKVRFWHWYFIPATVKKTFYVPYKSYLERSLLQLREVSFTPSPPVFTETLIDSLKTLKRRFKRIDGWGRLAN
ncbi:MAG: hypothetical protein RL173_170 [Fibrobacterota bacterium]|jgi:hypothetical protein